MLNFEPANDQPHLRTVRFVHLWAEEVIRQVERVKQARHRASVAFRMQGDEPGIDQEYLDRGLRDRWAAEHTLLWAAYQLERWRARLDRERLVTERESDKDLQRARNALEHLDTAEFTSGTFGDVAVAPAWEPPQEAGKRKPKDPYWSLRKLGGIQLDLPDNGPFCGIAADDLLSRALGVVKSVEDDLADEAREHLAELMRGR